jgi:hypothetical protein
MLRLPSELGSPVARGAAAAAADGAPPPGRRLGSGEVSAERTAAARAWRLAPPTDSPIRCGRCGAGLRGVAHAWMHERRAALCVGCAEAEGVEVGESKRYRRWRAQQRGGS